MGLIQKQDLKTLAELQGLGADENSLIDDSLIYIKASNKNALLQSIIQNLFSDINRFGFVDNSQTTISFDPNTYTFTLTSVGAGWYYIRSGRINYVIGNKTVVLAGSPPSANRYFIYIDDNSGTLTASTTPWTLLDTKLPVAIVIWDNALTPKYWLEDERHQALIDRRTHYYNHNVFGTRVISGSTLAGYTVTPGAPVDGDNTFSISQASIADEDILHTLSSLSDPDGATNAYYVYYRTGVSTWVWEVAQVPFRYTAAGYIQYDNAGTMTQGANNKFYNWYLIYTNISGDGRFLLIPGRAEFSNVGDAQAEDPTQFDWSGLSISEWVIAYQITFSTGNAYGTKGKVRIAATPRRINSNVSSPTVSGINIDHNSLLNLQGGSASERYHLTLAQHILATQYASGSQGGLLSSADWTVFNGKGSGGGGSLVWRNANTDGSGTACEEETEYGQLVYKFNAGGGQYLDVCYRVPSDYIAGTPIKLYGKFYSDASGGNVLLKTRSILIRNGTDQIDSTANTYNSTNAAVIPAAATTEYLFQADITDGSGEITEPVSANDTILIRLTRDASDTNTGTVRFMPGLSVIK